MSEAGLLLVRQEMDKASEELSSNYLHPFFLQQYYLKAYLDVMNLHAGHESYDRSPFLLVYENQSDGNPHSVIAFVWDSITTIVRYHCDKCSKEFPTLAELDYHKISKHTGQLSGS